MVLFDPIACIRCHEFADRSGMGAVEVKSFAPFRIVTSRKIVFRKMLEITAFRTFVIVYDIQDNSQAQAVCGVHEFPKVVWLPVEAVGAKNPLRHIPSRSGRENPQQA